MKTEETPSQWIERNFYVPDPRDPITGEQFPPGPIRLSDLQKRLVDEALSKRADGLFKYSTIVYSTIKKSGKSTLTSAVILYMAYHTPNSYVACLANDGKQANDRLYGPIYTNFRLHRQLGGIFKNETPNIDEVILSNFTKIEAVPCDAAGEAGSQPLMTAVSELWGFDTPTKKRLWTEMTIPPTLYGRAIRWVESYAGFTGVSKVLEQVYDTGFAKGTPHPDFLDIIADDGPAVRVNENARMFTYWDNMPRMPWQSKEYYAEEAQILDPSEFDRIHRNRWVSGIGTFIQKSWWDSCIDETLYPLRDGSSTPVVVGIDMAVSRDCAAMVAVTRSPYSPQSAVAIRAVRIFSPKQMGTVIDQSTMIEPVIRDWRKRWNVVCWAYDPREMTKLAQDLSREGLGWFMPFGQNQPRSIADKMLHDMVLHKQVHWNPHTSEGDIGLPGDQRDVQTLYKHMVGAGAVTTSGAYRLEKLAATGFPIDGAVALSEATYECMKLALDNTENRPESLINQLQSGKITTEEFSKLISQVNPELLERIRHGK